MKHKTLIFLLLLCLLPEALYSAQSVKQTEKEEYEAIPYHVLIISSYSSGYSWSDDIIDYIGGELSLSKRHNYEISLEYLSSEFQQEPQNWKFRMNVILNSYRKQIPDLIVIIADEAWFAFREARKKYYEDVPVVLVAVESLS